MDIFLSVGEFLLFTFIFIMLIVTESISKYQ